jgi:hypothetical protein
LVVGPSWSSVWALVFLSLAITSGMPRRLCFPVIGVYW